eukprot:jgi/Tetstr1/442002/TSEL_003152.t1
MAGAANAESFELVKKLHEGQQGTANLMRNKLTGELVAVKFIQRGPKVDENVEREIMCHRGLSHGNVVQFLEVFLTPEYLGIVMEYTSHGEMFDYVASKGQLAEAEARYFFQQLVCGVEYCHKMGVVHRDLKLENTLLHMEEGHAPRVKICDFGYSKSMHYHSMPNSTVGTPAYIAPEVFLRSSSEGAYSGEASDVWSCGVLLFVMLFGTYPFGDPDGGGDASIATVIERIVTAQYSFPPGVPVSAEVVDLFSKIFVPEASQRISISGIRSHPFFTVNLPWEFQVNAPLPVSVRQSDEDTLAILQEAKRADHSMQVPAWADDVMEVDISPTPVSSMDNEAADWAITADELKDMLACIDVAQEASSPTPAQAPQGLGGMRLPGGGAARHVPPRLSPAASTGSSGGFDPLGWKSHPVPASSAVSSEVVHVSASSEVSSAPMGLGLGGGLNPRRRK